MKVVPKTGDVAQAFVQSFFPNHKKYIKPPHGCLLTPDNTHLILKHTLYDLKCSPQHWYKTCKNTLIKLGLQPLPNAPCIVTGTLIAGEHPICLRFIDNRVLYFSASSKVEDKFKAETFRNEYKVDFQDEIHIF